MPSVKALVMMVTQTSCLCFLLVVLLNTLLVVETESSQKVTQTGDILLGGIFPVHQKGKGKFPGFLKLKFTQIFRHS